MTFKSASTLKFVDVILWLSLILSLLFITVCLRNWCVYMKYVPTNYTWNEISHLKCAFRIFMAVWIRAIMRLYVIKWICLIHAIIPSAFIFGLWLVISLIWSHLNSVCFFIRRQFPKTSESAGTMDFIVWFVDLNYVTGHRKWSTFRWHNIPLANE